MFKESVTSNSSSSEVAGGWKGTEGKHYILSQASAFTVGY